MELISPDAHASYPPMRTPHTLTTRSPGILTGVKGVGVVLAVVLAAAACASGSKAALEQRTTQGPQAEELWVLRVALANGREPTFEERLHWERQLDLAISRYLATDQEAANSPHVLTFKSALLDAVGLS